MLEVPKNGFTSCFDFEGPMKKYLKLDGFPSTEVEMEVINPYGTRAEDGCLPGNPDDKTRMSIKLACILLLGIFYCKYLWGSLTRTSAVPTDELLFDLSKII